MYIRDILDSTTALDDENLEIAGYNLLRADHASNSERCGVCIYYKSFLPLRLIDVHYLQRSHTKRNSLETRAVFKEFSEYFNNSGVVVY